MARAPWLSVWCACRGSNKSRIAIAPSLWLGFICTLGAKLEAEAVFFVLEMEVKGRKRQELQLLLTQSEAYSWEEIFGGNINPGLAAYQGFLPGRDHILIRSQFYMAKKM